MSQAQRKKELPDATQESKQMPSVQQNTVELPNADQQTKAVPQFKFVGKDMPQIGKPQNTVMIGGKPYQIKPTKLKYQRNQTATFYRALQLYPLTDILAMSARQTGDGRDGDKSLMDWLIAVTDNEQLIIDNYDEMDTGTIQQMLQIYKRLNRHAEKQKNLKNLQAARKVVE